MTGQWADRHVQESWQPCAETGICGFGGRWRPLSGRGNLNRSSPHRLQCGVCATWPTVDDDHIGGGGRVTPKTTDCGGIVEGIVDLESSEGRKDRASNGRRRGGRKTRPTTDR